MALSLDAFHDASRPTRPQCSLVGIFAALDAKDRQVLEAALGDPQVTHSAIARILTDAGHMVRQNTVNRHRSGKCSCGTS